MEGFDTKVFLIMCSIIASFDKNKIKELAALNSYRGQHSYSITVFERHTFDVIYQSKGFGPLIVDNHNFVAEGAYIVAHQQAPTTDNKDIDSIHPAQIEHHMLWHNGIIKNKSVKELQQRLKSNTTWDTKLILQQLISIDNVDNIDGTFSCVWFNGTNLIAFRNDISPLFIDSKLNISSTKFEGSNSVLSNTMWLIDTSLSQEQLHTPKGLYPIKSFETVENPYYFSEMRHECEH